MDEKFQIYLGGEFRETEDQLAVSNPFTKKEFALAYRAGNSELEEAIRRALSIRDTLIDMPSGRKYNVLMDIASQLRDARKEFAETIVKESAKPLRYSLGEVDRAIQTFTVAAEEAKRLPGEFLDMEWTGPGEGKEAVVKYFPVGLIAGISPFNFPLNLAVHKLAPAIAAGCPIILKPSSSTPLTTLKLAQIIHKTELPGGAVSIMPMNRNTGNLMVSDERFSLLSFTGSPAVGWKMKSDAGKKKVILELGGNAGVIVSETADIETAVSKCLTGSFAYSGQVCIHTQRILVHEQIFEIFIQRFIAGAKALKAGDPMEESTDISAMIDEENAIRVEDWVQEALDAGAELLCGGKRNGNYFEPTVLTNTRQDMKVCGLEIFGPVVTIEKYSDFAEALAYINNSRYGLQAGVFTDKITEMNAAFRKLEVGGIMINDIPGFRVDHMPYGGVKDSGFGREGVKYSIHDMLEPRLLVKNK